MRSLERDKMHIVSISSIFNFNRVENDYFKKNPEKEYVVFCGLGGQGTLATKTMKDMGIKNVKNIKGGMAAWEKIK